VIAKLNRFLDRVERLNPKIDLPVAIFILACFALAGWIAGGHAGTLQ
jgi:hypothetical protein